MVFLTFRSDRLMQNYEITLKVSSNPKSASKFLILARVSRVVGGWAKRPKKCCPPSKVENFKKVVHDILQSIV